MLYVTDFLQSAAATPRASSASGSKNHRATLYCRQAFLIAAVRKSASEVPLRACSCKRNFKDAQPPFHSGWRLRWFDLQANLPDTPPHPRTASLLSGNSVLRADFFRRRPTPPRLHKDRLHVTPGLREESPPRNSPQRVPGGSGS